MPHCKFTILVIGDFLYISQNEVTVSSSGKEKDVLKKREKDKEESVLLDFANISKRHYKILPARSPISC